MGCDMGQSKYSASSKGITLVPLSTCDFMTRMRVNASRQRGGSQLLCHHDRGGRKMGWLEGDKVQKAVAARLVDRSRRPNRVRRYGADEFGTRSAVSGLSLRGI
jgi:hypothetical protein